MPWGPYFNTLPLAFLTQHRLWPMCWVLMIWPHCLIKHPRNRRLLLGFFALLTPTGQSFGPVSVTTKVSEAPISTKITNLSINTRTARSIPRAAPRADVPVLQAPSSATPGAGRLSLFLDSWKKVTLNSFILNIIEFGLKLDSYYSSYAPSLFWLSFSLPFSLSF